MSILGEMNLKTLFTVLYRLSISLVFSHADYFLGPAKRAARPQQVTHPTRPVLALKHCVPTLCRAQRQKSEAGWPDSSYTLEYTPRNVTMNINHLYV